MQIRIANLLACITFVFGLAGCGELLSEISLDESFNNLINLSTVDSVVSLNEGSSLTLVIFLDKAVEDTTSLNWSIANGEFDFVDSSGVENLDAGEKSKSIVIQVSEDFVYEPNESYVLEVSGSNTQFSNSLSIEINLQDNDSPLANPTLALTDLATGSNLFAQAVPIGASVGNDGVAVKWCLSAQQITRPESVLSPCIGGEGGSNGWVTGAAPTTFTLTGADEAKRVYIWIADLNGNINADTIFADITLDTTRPATPSLSVNDVISESSTQTYSSSVNVTITLDTDAEEWCLIEQDQISGAPSPAWNAACFTSVRPSTALVSLAGARRFYLFTKDGAENVSLGSSSDITYSVNQGPTAVIDGAIIVDQAGGAQELTVLANDTDPELEVLKIVVNTAATSGTVAIINSGDGITYSPNLGFTGVDTFNYTIEDPRGAQSSASVTVHVYSKFTWTGLDVSNNWSAGSNWCGTISGGACQGTADQPGALDKVVFNQFCTNCDVTIDQPVSPGGLLMHIGYTGTVTQSLANTVSVGSIGWEQKAGVFLGGSGDISVAGDFLFSGGSFTSTSGSLNPQANFSPSGSASFTHNSGLVNFSGTLSQTASGGGFTYNDIRFSSACCDGFEDIDGVFNVSGDLIVAVTTSYLVNGTGVLNISGNVNTISSGGGSVTYKMVGTSDQTLTGGSYPGIEIASGGGVVKFLGDHIVTGNFSRSSGVVDFDRTTTTIKSGLLYTIDSTGLNYYNLKIVPGCCSGLAAFSSDVFVENNLIYTSDYVLADAISITVGGDVSLSKGSNIGNSAYSLILNGLGQQKFDHVDGNFPSGNITINKSAGEVILQSDIVMGSGSDLIVIAGVVNMNGYDLTVGNVLTLGGETEIRMGCNLLTVNSVVQGAGVFGSGNIYGGANSPIVVIADTGNREGQALSFTVGLNAPYCAGSLTIDYATSDGTAIAGSPGTDYTDSSGTLTFLAGEFSKTVVVSTLADVTVESDETVNVTLSNMSVGWMRKSVGVGVILNDDSNDTVWTGDGGDSLWSTAGNWSGGVVPSLVDVAYFDDSCSGCEVIIDAAVDIKGVYISSDFPGVITQSGINGISIGLQGWKQFGGEFIGGTGAITFASSPLFNGGIFQSTTGTLDIDYISFDAASYVFIQNGGTFYHNNGTVLFSGSSSSCGGGCVSTTASQVSAMGAQLKLNNVIIDVNDLNSVAGYNELEIRLLYENRFVVLGSLGIVDGTLNGGTVRLYGNYNLSCASASSCAGQADDPATKIELVGDALQEFTTEVGAYGGYLSVNNPNKVFSVTGDTNLNLTDLEIKSGSTFMAPTGTLTLGNDIGVTISSKSVGLIVRAGGVFDANGGSVNIVSSVSAASDTVSTFLFNAAGILTFNNLFIDSTNIVANRGSLVTISAGDSLVVEGDLVIDDGAFDGGEVKLAGNLSLNCTDPATSCADAGATDFLLNGIGVIQDISIQTGATLTAGTFTCSQSGGGTVRQLTAIELLSAGQDLTITSGTWDMNSFSLDISDILLLNSTINKNGGALTVNGSLIPDGPYGIGTINP